jgi:hypothetical protein
MAGTTKTPHTETAAGRREAAAKGAALPSKSGGAPRYPTPNRAYLAKAIKAVGRGKGDHATIRRYLIRRAKALGAMDMIPDSWKSDGSN